MFERCWRAYRLLEQCRCLLKSELGWEVELAAFVEWVEP